METKTLNVRNYPRIVQEFANENFNLKILSAALIGIMFILLVLVAILVRKGPVVVALDGGGQIAKVESKITDAQIREAAENYLRYRYQWTFESINSQLKRAELFVDPDLVGAFRRSMVDVQKFVSEKKVKQKVYPYDMKVNFKERKITVLADRITEFDNLRAASAMKVVLNFSIGDRTSINPWGIYIAKETEGTKE